MFEKLVATADGVFGNMRGDQPEKLRLRYDDLKAINPRIVCAHLSAYGCDGSRKGWPGYDFRPGGVRLSRSPASRTPARALWPVHGRLHDRDDRGIRSDVRPARGARDRVGRDVEVSLYDVAIHQLSYPATWYLNEGLETTRLPRSAHPYLVPSQLYRTQDGWIFFMCQTQRFWELLCAKIGRPDLIDEPMYRDQAARHANRDQLTEVLDEALSARPRRNGSRCSAARAVRPVYDVRQALENPFLAERDGVQVLDHPDGPASSCSRARSAWAPKLPAPRPSSGQDTDALLEELGYDPAEIEALRAGRDLSARDAARHACRPRRCRPHGTTQQRERLGAVTPSSPGL